MSQLKVYGVAASRTFRTLWMAKELGIAFEHIPVDFRNGENLKPDYLAINPSGQIPAIADGGFLLRESLAINLYLAKKYGLGRLYPTDLEGEARAWQWSFFAATNLESQVRAWPADMTLPAAESLERDPHNANPLVVLARSVGVLNHALSSSPYVLGEAFTVADLNLAAVLSRTVGRNYGSAARVADWLRRCVARPAAVAAQTLREQAATVGA